MDDKGITIQIHEEGTLVPFFFPQSYIRIPPGFESRNEITTFAEKRLPHPYSSCHDETSVKDAVGESFINDPSLCVQFCLQRRIVEHCGCHASLFPVPSDVDLKETKKCFVEGNKTHVEYAELKCVRGIIEGAQKSTDYCHKECPESCFSVTYSQTHSRNNWPSYDSKLKAYDDLIRPKLHNFGNIFSEYEDILNISLTNATEAKFRLSKIMIIEENIAKIIVSQRESNVQYIRDEPLIPLETFLSQIGGICGLWIGLSVVGCMEFVELIFDILTILFKRRKNIVFNCANHENQNPTSQL